MSTEDVDISSLAVSTPTAFVIDDEKLTQQIATFKNMVQDTIEKVPEGDKPYWISDHLFKRVIRARKGDLNAAKKMYAEIIKFRSEKAVHTLLEKYREPEVLRRYFPWGFSGLDKEGYPVLVERIGTIDLVGIGGALGTEKYLEWVTWYHELQEKVLREICSILGKDCHMMTCIIDMNGISLRHCSATTLNLVQARIRLEEDNYPEVARKVLLINTPSIFSTVWSGIRGFLDEGTASKFEIKGSDYLPMLRKYIPDSSIPAYLGGTLVDKYNDPYCASIVSLGGVVPGDFVMNVATDGKGPGAEAQVGSGKRSDVLLQVPAGARVSWRWAAQEDDIAFGVYAAPLARDGEEKHANPDDLTLNIVTGSAYALHKAPCKTAVPENGHFSVLFKPNKTANDKIPFASAKASATEVVAPKTMTKHFGEWTAPADGDAMHYVVRLIWDNSSSWIKSKTFFRRVDAILPEDLAIEKALDEYHDHVNATLFNEEGATMPIPEGADRIWRFHDEDHIKAIERKRRMATVKSWAKIDDSA